METTMEGNPPKCISCPECFSTLAVSKNHCEQARPHNWEKRNGVKTCKNCLTQEVDDIPDIETVMIFKKDNVWINNEGEEVGDNLIKKYNIKGRYLRNGTFDERDDIKSMIVNKER